MAEVLRKNIWFSLPIPKIKFDPPAQGKNALVFIFQVINQKEMTKDFSVGGGGLKIF